MKNRTRIAAAALILAAAALWDSNRRIVTQGIEIASPRIPDGFDGFRIAHLSDLHGAVFGKRNARLLEAVRRAEPDLIAVTGDLTDEYTGPGYAPELISALLPIAPVLFVTGNHEWNRGDAPALCETVEALGARVLRNECAVLERGGGRLLIAGADDEKGPGGRAAQERLISRLREENDYLIVLVHRNDRLPLLASLGADLLLSGHAHGGVVRLPFTDGLVGPGPVLLPSFTSGEYALGNGRMVVSRGLGSHSCMLRLFNNPHIPVITLKKG